MVAWKRYVSWLTMPMFSSSDSCSRSRTSSPENSTRPPVTSWKRGMRYDTVVLPAPDGPTNAANWPGWISNDMPSSVGRSPARVSG